MILVCGDAMDDEYWFGDVSRISPEAPVPVVKILRKEYRPGAAANVAKNCEAMGAQVSTATINVATKVRIIGKQQQVVRIDFDRTPSEDEVQEMHRDFFERLPAATIVIFSDYGKGSLVRVAELIRFAKAAGKTILVDPKGHDYTKYKGADLIKPNQEEMKTMVGGWSNDEQLAAKASLIDMTLLVTRGAEGMTLFKDGSSYHYHALAKEVYDVSGAGDTTIAALAVALERGIPLEDAVPYANKAAGLVVGRFGTTVATEEEVFGLG